MDATSEPVPSVPNHPQQQQQDGTMPLEMTSEEELSPTTVLSFDRACVVFSNHGTLALEKVFLASPELSNPVFMRAFSEKLESYLGLLDKPGGITYGDLHNTFQSSFIISVQEGCDVVKANTAYQQQLQQQQNHHQQQQFFQQQQQQQQQYQLQLQLQQKQRMQQQLYQQQQHHLQQLHQQQQQQQHHHQHQLQQQQTQLQQAFSRKRPLAPSASVPSSIFTTWTARGAKLELPRQKDECMVITEAALLQSLETNAKILGEAYGLVEAHKRKLTVSQSRVEDASEVAQRFAYLLDFSKKALTNIAELADGTSRGTMASMIPKLMLSIDPEKVNEHLRGIVWGTKDVEEAKRVAREKDPKCILNFILPPLSDGGGGEGDLVAGAIAGGSEEADI